MGILCFTYLFRHEILLKLAQILIVEDSLKHANYTFVLSGSPYDRGSLAAQFFHQKATDTIVCTGKNIPHDFKAMGWEITESEIARNFIQLQKVPASNIIIIKEGTSTHEEANAILEFCEKRAIKKIIIVSTDFHTRRIQKVFKTKFAQKNIEIIIRAAPSSSYNSQAWWKSEYGLISLQNEYVKLGYYFLKY